ncbi:DUF3658 domain-containing protein [Methylobacterium sp. WL120]|uniref:DUF3658 domain-containing protein n=1 Tax=Methylobacterium sp. WL120 TaxID=2603887 RepID=UPI0011C72942|nr:DUF3658 domain-containing protein [Methylobacterium sp. WL120]TXM63822.1 hypothetical protein FV229_20930 [Methylobacterium sp. WL120]
MDQPVAMSIADVSVAAMIDDEIMRAAKERWQKVAMITAIIIHANLRRGINDTAIAERIKLLVSLGKLEVQGNLDRMRYSEVRLPPR